MYRPLLCGCSFQLTPCLGARPVGGGATIASLLSDIAPDRRRQCPQQQGEECPQRRIPSSVRNQFRVQWAQKVAHGPEELSHSESREHQYYHRRQGPRKEAVDQPATPLCPVPRRTLVSMM